MQDEGQQSVTNQLNAVATTAKQMQLQVVQPSLPVHPEILSHQLNPILDRWRWSPVHNGNPVNQAKFRIRRQSKGYIRAKADVNHKLFK